MKSQMLKLFVLLLACGIAHGIGVSTPEFIDITYPGSLDTRLQDINNRGQIVGFHDGGSGFLYEDGIFTPIHYPEALSTSPYGINDHSQVVGVFTDPAGTHGFVCRRDVYSPLDVPGASLTQAYGINNRGEIAGDCIIDELAYGWVFDGDGYSILAFPGASATSAKGVNDRGQVAGWYYVDGPLAGGFLYDRGRYFPFNDVAGTLPRFWDINTRGQIIGQIWGPGRGFVLYKEDVTLLEFPGSDSTFGRGINDHGQAVGFYSSGGEYHGYLIR